MIYDNNCGDWAKVVVLYQNVGHISSYSCCHGVHLEASWIVSPVALIFSKWISSTKLKNKKFKNVCFNKNQQKAQCAFTYDAVWKSNSFNGPIFRTDEFWTLNIAHRTCFWYGMGNLYHGIKYNFMMIISFWNEICQLLNSVSRRPQVNTFISLDSLPFLWHFVPCNTWLSFQHSIRLHIHSYPNFEAANLISLIWLKALESNNNDNLPQLRQKSIWWSK